MDDGSTDETPAILAGLAADPANRMRVVRTGNRGPAAARNHAIGLAGEAFVAFIDADDLWPEGKLEAQIERFRMRPDLDVVLGQVTVEDIPGFEGASRRVLRDDIHWAIVTPNVGAGVYRASAFRRIGRFDEALRFGEDVDWQMRAIESGLRLAVLARVTLIWRHHDTNMTSDLSGAQHGFMQALKRSLDRRRATGMKLRSLPNIADFLEQDPSTP